MLRAEHGLRDAGDALVDAALEAGGRDNITVVLFRLEEVGAPSSAPRREPTHGTDARPACRRSPPAG